MEKSKTGGEHAPVVVDEEVVVDPAIVELEVVGLAPVHDVDVEVEVVWASMEVVEDVEEAEVLAILEVEEVLEVETMDVDALRVVVIEDDVMLVLVELGIAELEDVMLEVYVELVVRLALVHDTDVEAEVVVVLQNVFCLATATSCSSGCSELQKPDCWKHLSALFQ